MHVRIDPAGNDILPARIDHAGRLEIERPRRCEDDDAAVLDPDVEWLARIGGDDGAALDQNVEHG